MRIQDLPALHVASPDLGPDLVQAVSHIEIAAGRAGGKSDRATSLIKAFNVCIGKLLGLLPNGADLSATGQTNAIVTNTQVLPVGIGKNAANADIGTLTITVVDGVITKVQSSV